jgi:hypothetical protein
MKSIRTSTIFIWILTQTFISIFFYIGDKFISGGEAVITFLLSIPLTMFVQWLRDLITTKNISNSEEQDNSEISQ